MVTSRTTSLTASGVSALPNRNAPTRASWRIASVSLSSAAAVAIGSGDRGVEPLLRFDLELGAHVPNGAHDIYQQFDLIRRGSVGLSPGVQILLGQACCRVRVGRDHDRFREIGLVRESGGEVLPDLLGYERHERVQQSQHTLQHVRQHPARLVIPVAQAHFREFDVPVGEVAPDEIVQHALRLAELGTR